MTVEKALQELNDGGFHIVQKAPDEFKIYPTGLGGFNEYEPPFTINSTELLEIHSRYIG
jgi:hypothetical protein